MPTLVVTAVGVLAIGIVIPVDVTGNTADDGDTAETSGQHRAHSDDDATDDGKSGSDGGVEHDDEVGSADNDGSGDQKKVVVGHDTTSEGGKCDDPDYSSLDDAFEDLDELESVHLCKGAYTVDAPLTVGSDNIKITGSTRHDVTIDASGYAGDDAPFRVTGDNVSIKGIEFSGSKGYGISAPDADGLDVDNNEFRDNTAGAVEAVDGEHAVVENNTIAADGADSAVTLRDTQNSTVASNVISGNRKEPAIALAGGNDTVAVQGNRISDSGSAVYVDKTDKAEAANQDVDIDLNSFEDGVSNGVTVTSEAAVADGTVPAADNYWGCAEGAGEGCASSSVSDDAEVEIDTKHPLLAPLSDSNSDTNAAGVGNTGWRSWDVSPGGTTGAVYGTGTMTEVTFDDTPRDEIADTSGSFTSVTSTGDFKYFGVGTDRFLDPGPEGDDEPDEPLRWYDTSGDEPSWKKVDSSNRTDPATIDENSTPAVDELEGAVFVAQDK